MSDDIYAEAIRERDELRKHLAGLEARLASPADFNGAFRRAVGRRPPGPSQEPQAAHGDTGHVGIDWPTPPVQPSINESIRRAARRGRLDETAEDRRATERRS